MAINELLQRDLGDEINVNDDGGGPINTVDGGDVSGGGTSNAIEAADAQLEEFIAEGGWALPIVYGEHFIAGGAIVHKFTEGTPNTSIVYVAIAEGQGNGGGHGELASAVAVYYAGAAQSVSPDGSTAGYRFHNGYISTGVASGNQQVDAFLSGNLAYSGTAYIAIKLTDDDANAEDRPDKLRARIQGRQVYDFDSVGRNVGYGYSTNAARVAIDRILCYYEQKSPNDAALAFRNMQEKINWEFWKVWRDYNGAPISWNNGTTTSDVTRFECNLAITQEDVNLATVLDQICATAGAFWQHDGEQFIFLTPEEREPVHHFHPQNIASGSFRVEPRDLRDCVNYIVVEFRDFDDQYLGLSSTEVRREELRERAGKIQSTRTLPPMKKTQADRLAERMARLEADNRNICSLVGDETNIHIRQGDFVTVSHPLPPWNYQRCLVQSAVISFPEGSPGMGEFVLQAIDDDTYSDTAHGPRQEALTP